MLSVVTSGLPEFAPSASQEHPKFNLVPFSCLSIPTASQVRFSVLPDCLLDLIPSSASQGHPKFNLAPCSCQSIPSASQVSSPVLPACLLDLIPKFSFVPCSCQSISVASQVHGIPKNVWRSPAAPPTSFSASHWHPNALTTPFF